MRKLTLTVLSAASVIAALALSGCATGDQALSGGDAGGSPGEEIVIGSADFSESQLIATIYSLALQDAGVEVREQFNIGSREVYIAALQDGSIDLIPEYSGALLKHFDPESKASTSEDVVDELSDALPEGIEMYDISEAQDKDILAVTEDTATQYDLETISDLEPVASELILGGPAEWVTRVNGVVGLRDVLAELARLASFDWRMVEAARVDREAVPVADCIGGRTELPGRGLGGRHVGRRLRLERRAQEALFVFHTPVVRIRSCTEHQRQTENCE